RERCMEKGVPKSFLDVDAWDIEAEKVIGTGNKMLEVAQAQKLMEARLAYDPEAQRQILHIYTEAMTDDPQLAETLVPSTEQPPSATVEKATFAWGTLMTGAPVVIATPINESEYIETLLMLLGRQIQVIEQTGGQMADPQTLTGLANVAQEIQKHIAVFATDPAQREKTAMYLNALNQEANFIRAYAQRLEEQMQAQGQQMDPTAKAKVDAIYMQAQAKADVTRRTNEVKMQQKEQAFIRDQTRRDAKS